MLPKTLWSVCLLAIFTTTSLAGESQIGELFEFETDRVVELSAFGVAIDTVAITNSEDRPAAAELANFLNGVSRKGIADIPNPSWFNNREHALPVRISVPLPLGGVREGETLDCRVESMSGQPIAGMMVARTQLKSSDPGDDRVHALATGVVSRDGAQIAGGVHVLRDCVDVIAEERTVSGANKRQVSVSLRLKNNEGQAANLRVLSAVAERVEEDYSHNFGQSKVKVTPLVAIDGTQRLRIRVPENYQMHVNQFVVEVGGMKISIPDALVRDPSEADSSAITANVRIEQSYRDRILRGLSYVPSVRVEVSGRFKAKTETPLDGEVGDGKSAQPTVVFASIAIPRGYLETLHQHRAPNAALSEPTRASMNALEREVKTDVENFVEQILPRLSLGEDEFKQVRVVFFDSIASGPDMLPAPPR